MSTLKQNFAPLDMSALSRWYSQKLGCQLRLVHTDVPCDLADLTPAEREQLNTYLNDKRRQTWLLGRAALKQLLKAFGESLDTSLLAFPNARFSLTHNVCQAFAVAVLPEPGQVIAGVGIDFENWRPIRDGATRFFLTPTEQQWLRDFSREGTVEAADKEKMRLWTVKEAVLKSDPNNAGRNYHHYSLSQPKAEVGWAARDPRTFRYVSRILDRGALSVSICLEN